MLHSDYRPLCEVNLPFADRQMYMHTFDLANPVMARGYEDYLEPVVQLCRSAHATDGVAHMTVDEKIVAVGMSQRRPKPHIDGCFMPQAMVWGFPPPPGPFWAHGCNDIRLADIGRMPVIVAANVSGCRAWRGTFACQPASDGDLSHIEHLLGEGEIIPPNVGYLLSPDCVHESMIFARPTRYVRTVHDYHFCSRPRRRF